MTRSAALLVLPVQPGIGAPKDGFPTSLRSLVQALEDLALAERVERALHATGYPALRRIAVTVHARVVILEGRVSTYHLKQVAQETALTVAEAQQVCNNLEVARPS
jgi:osmotically-inducible protein OsmY